MSVPWERLHLDFFPPQIYILILLEIWRVSFHILQASLLQVNLLCQITLLPSALSIYTPVLVGPRERNHHRVCLAKFTKCPDCVSHNVTPLSVSRQRCHGTYNHPLPACSSSLGDLLSGFTLLFCLFACSTFSTDVCICNNKQVIPFSWSNCSCRPFPNLQRSSLTHRHVAASKPQPQGTTC